jgi:EpsI family protein
MTSRRSAFLMLGTMGAAAGLGLIVRPTEHVRKGKADFQLSEIVPEKFGGWAAAPKVATTVNPQAQELLDKIYSQILERTYIHSDGYAIMLAIAYGNDQRGSLEAHKPEVCYPAQGFKVTQTSSDQMITGFGALPITKLATVAGLRHEPLLYWFTVADNVVTNRFERRMAQVKQAVTGQIPDGLLFRVSSIDTNQEQAWRMQETFVRDLLQSVTPSARVRLAGLK